ncbi:hypothetical protein Dimus_031617 [Dionaea muscipula]
MKDNGLNNMMELIKRHRWEKLFKRTEFYARMTVVHLKKKDVVTSSVRGVSIEFDHLKLVSILVQAESGLDDLFFDAQVDVEEPVAEIPSVPAFPASPGDSIIEQKEPEASGVDPSGPSGHLPESVMIKFQAEFESARANRIQSDLEKAQTENARLVALLQQAKTPPKP